MNALVVYGTRWGGTAGVAEKIGEALRKEGITVNIVGSKNIPKDIVTYDLFIVGSGIRADKWTTETLLFLERKAQLLKQKKTALYVSCQMADRKDEARDKAKTKYLKETAEKYGLQPISFGFFGGFMDFHQSHGLIVDIMMKVNRKKLRKNGLDQTKTLDTRNWSEIQVWTRQVAALALDSS